MQDPQFRILKFFSVSCAKLMAQMAERTTKTDLGIFICRDFTDRLVHRYIHFATSSWLRQDLWTKKQTEGGGAHSENCFFMKWSLHLLTITENFLNNLNSCMPWTSQNYFSECISLHCVTLQICDTTVLKKKKKKKKSLGLPLPPQQQQKQYSRGKRKD